MRYGNACLALPVIYLFDRVCVARGYNKACITITFIPSNKYSTNEVLISLCFSKHQTTPNVKGFVFLMIMELELILRDIIKFKAIQTISRLKICIRSFIYVFLFKFLALKIPELILKHIPVIWYKLMKPLKFFKNSH